jgi:hypothetical protein
MLQTKWVSPDVLKPNLHNARTHSKKQVRQIHDSIAAFGSDLKSYNRHGIT